MTEALHKVLEFAFEIGLNRVEGLPLAGNRAAIGVLEKVGMRNEGELRQYCHQKGAFHDFAVYSILRDEHAT